MNLSGFRPQRLFQRKALGHWSQCWGEAVKDLFGLTAWPLGQVLVASEKVGLPTGLFIICQTMPHHSFIHSFHFVNKLLQWDATGMGQ